jgi:ABC-type nitrate/sulfonate/bicarbonate transport system substrate-binding protein
MTKLLNIVITLLAVALVAVILYPQIQDSRPKAVRFACDSTAASLPLLIGVEDSVFIKNRIIPELVFYSDPEQALAGLFAGDADVGVFPWSTVFKHLDTQNETLRVFASEDFRSTLPVDAIVVPVASKIKEVADLKKKKLGYPPQLRDYMAPFLINVNIAAEQLTVVEVPLGDLMTQLTAGAIDAAWLLEPLICALDTTEFRVLQPAALARYVSAPFPGAALGFSAEFLNSAGKVLLNRIKISTDAAIALTETQADRAKQVLAGYFPGCEGNQNLCRLPEYQRLIEINKSSISALASRLKVSGVIERDIETNKFLVEPAKLTR